MLLFKNVYLFEKQKTEMVIFHQLVHSLSGHNSWSWGWPWLKPGARCTIHASHTVGRDPSAISASPKAVHQRKAELELGARVDPRHSKMKCRLP